MAGSLVADDVGKGVDFGVREMGEWDGGLLGSVCRVLLVFSRERLWWTECGTSWADLSVWTWGVGCGVCCVLWETGT